MPLIKSTGLRIASAAPDLLAYYPRLRRPPPDGMGWVSRRWRASQSCSTIIAPNFADEHSATTVMAGRSFIHSAQHRETRSQIAGRKVLPFKVGLRAMRLETGKQYCRDKRRRYNPGVQSPVPGRWLDHKARRNPRRNEPVTWILPAVKPASAGATYPQASICCRSAVRLHDQRDPCPSQR